MYTVAYQDMLKGEEMLWAYAKEECSWVTCMYKLDQGSMMIHKMRNLETLREIVLRKAQTAKSYVTWVGNVTTARK